jgi:hypothetical protein
MLLPPGVNHTTGGNNPRFFVAHIMVGYMAGTDTVFRNPHVQASAHFGVSRGGAVWQWVDTDDQAWHAFAANNCSIGVEHAGFPWEPLTPAQIQASAKLYAWINQKYPAVHLWMNKRLEGSGLAYHEKYPEWNLDQHSCPGHLIEGQLDEILAIAKAVSP